jgi:hypothetical protein
MDELLQDEQKHKYHKKFDENFHYNLCCYGMILFIGKGHFKIFIKFLKDKKPNLLGQPVQTLFVEALDALFPPIFYNYTAHE